jgi:hypothetical protein
LGYEVSVIPKAGGTIADIAHAEEQVLTVLTDGHAAFWLSGQALVTVPLNGGQVTTLTTDLKYLQNIALFEDRIYWADASVTGGFADTIYYTGKTGGSVNTLATGLASPAFLAFDLDGTLIYADSGPSGFEASGIYRVSATGAVSRLIIGLEGGTDLAVDENYVYTPQGYNIKSTSLQDGATRFICSTGFEISGIDTDGSYVYWLQGPLVSVFRASGDLTGSVQPITTSKSYMPLDLQVRGNDVYWIAGSSKLFRAPVNGGDAQEIPSHLASATNLLVDDQYIYVIDAGASRLVKIPLTGGAQTTMALTERYYGWYAMTQDTDNVYWADPVGLYKVSKITGIQSTYSYPVLQDQGGIPATIAVDNRYLYWTESLTGTIKRELK